MSRIEIKSFVKINLSIDVGAVMDNGFHPVDMVMQQLSFHDDVTVEYMPPSPGSVKAFEAASQDGGSFDIEVNTNRYYLPADRRNLAYQAAELMINRFGGRAPRAEEERDDFDAADRDDTEKAPKEKPVQAANGKIKIDIRKRIPVAGGLAGGSGNAAAVLLAINTLWNLHLSLEDIMDLGKELGSDVPFCIMGQAKANDNMPAYLQKDSMAASAARATGRGTELQPVAPLKCWVVIAKPHFSVSTKEVYQGIDNMEITERPDNDRLVGRMSGSAAKRKASYAVPDKEMYEDFVNVLEAYTLKTYPAVQDLKDTMRELGAEYALMSGSGPTVFGIFGSMKAAEKAALGIQETGLEAYWTKTIL